ncbi:Pml39p SCDLUD_001280 [Saccharomycodes ludwigii]|uniref:Pml39p n=1 Tax=Saccharomycodes ludwigii TaxID=36035 RepID=UPI001E836DC6|nr:hypothetical protein SCDLUD_001280 [Saccharomycodes ludwigii]KAH3903635.1 hypothetical protein SCDLUD_001280 [Saccharomycodes ludwigii]
MTEKFGKEKNHTVTTTNIGNIYSTNNIEYQEYSNKLRKILDKNVIGADSKNSDRLNVTRLYKIDKHYCSKIKKNDKEQQSILKYNNMTFFLNEKLSPIVKHINNSIKLLTESYLIFDPQSFNPVIIASHGWSLLNRKNKNKYKNTIFLYCDICHKMLCFTFDAHNYCSFDFLKKDLVTFDKHKYTAQLVSAHSKSCYWHTHTFDYLNKYYITENNLILDVERLGHGNEISTELSPSLKLQGWDPFESTDSNKYVKCKMCFKICQIQEIQNNDFNRHETWCRYRSNLEILVKKLGTHNDTDDKTVEFFDRVKKLEIFLESL